MSNVSTQQGIRLATARRARRTHRVRVEKGARLRLGRDHVAEQYLRPSLVTARREELIASGYPVHIATLAVRMEGRENTLLDATASRALSEDEQHELRILQQQLHALADHNKALTQEASLELPAEVAERVAAGELVYDVDVTDAEEHRFRVFFTTYDGEPDATWVQDAETGTLLDWRGPKAEEILERYFPAAAAELAASNRAAA